MGSILSGKIKSIKHDTAGAFAGAEVDLGVIDDCQIDFEVAKYESAMGDYQVGGRGKLRIVLAETGDTLETIVDALDGTETYFQITAFDDTTFTTSAVTPMVDGDRPFNDPTDPHKYIVEVDEEFDAESDFITIA